MARLEDFVADLRRNFAGDIRLDLASRLLYSTDASIYQIEPLGVVLPRTQEDLHAAVELAAKYQIPILARGAGSSLAGQAIGAAVILDCSRWLDKIVEIDGLERRAKVEPGVVLSRLNREAAEQGLQFGPDPASADRATIGGVIGNNATGAHSIIYGMTADHLQSADVVLADGSLATLGEVKARPAGAPSTGGPGEERRIAALPSAPRYGAIVEAAFEIGERYVEEIKRRFPRTWRNSAGYRLNYLLPWSATRPSEWTGGSYPADDRAKAFNLSQLLAGSEGTLAVIRQATVSLVTKPKHTVLGVLSYASVDGACDMVPSILAHHPAAIELIPRMIVDLAREAPAYAFQAGWVAGDPEALLVVEFAGDNPLLLRQSAEALRDDVLIAESAAEQARVWGLRKAGLGIIDSRPQSARSATFIEDCAIPVEHLGEFVRDLRRIMAEHKAEGGIYGHASAGCLHARPVLDLKTLAGVHAMREIAEQTLALALRLGGSMASEHGDGIARGEWLRQTYGPDIAEAISMLKRAADPQEILSPRKMLESPPMDTHLRYGANYRAQTWTPGIEFGRQGGLAMAIEQCNGQALCRKVDGVMCPSFQATREEMHSTRGRANLLRALISTGFADLPLAAVPNSSAVDGAEGRGAISEAVFRALDLCLGCKGCKGECPSGVDMAKLKSTFLEEYHHGRPRLARDYAFGYFHITARVLSLLTPFMNAANRIGIVHRVISRAMAITPERPFPSFAPRLAKPPREAGVKPVLMLRDPFTHYVDSEVEQAAFDLLRRAGFEVRLLTAMGAGASLVSNGFLRSARRHAKSVLDEVARKDPSGSIPVVTIEPSELSTLRNDYPDLLPDSEAAKLKQLTGARGVDQLLLETGAFSDMRVATTSKHILFHSHCHERADERGGGSFASLGLLRAAGYQVRILDEGCCGMAGTFGYEAEHYELSQKIAALRLVPRIAESPGAGVAATGAACRMQIAQNTKASVAHPLVWVRRALVPS